LRRRALAGWAALHADLADALSQWTRTVHLDEDVPPPRFAAMAAVLVEQQADALREALARARADADPDALHQARIAGKRLRYLLEPLGDEIPSAAALVGELKRLQDALGVVQDAHVFAREIAAAVEAAGEERARSLSAEVAREADLDDGSAALDDPLPGLLALARRLGRERAAAQASLQRDWLGDDDPAPLAPVTEVVAALRAHAAHDALEVERKYLLRAVPPMAAAVAPRVIEQGYLPGTRIAERLRRERRDGGVRCTRTVKDGRGVARIELEEEIAAELFERLWPLTMGRRVTKERHPVRDGALTWEVDRFTDRDLVLAEVELTDAEARPELPAWLAPYVEREVTGEDAYVNVNLAR
jgi:CYTH domain-containing protein